MRRAPGFQPVPSGRDALDLTPNLSACAGSGSADRGNFGLGCGGQLVVDRGTVLVRARLWFEVLIAVADEAPRLDAAVVTALADEADPEETGADVSVSELPCQFGNDVGVTSS